jgi:hypothetical protein
VVQVLLRLTASHKTTEIRKDISNAGPNPVRGQRQQSRVTDRIGSLAAMVIP